SLARLRRMRSSRNGARHFSAKEDDKFCHKNWFAPSRPVDICSEFFSSAHVSIDIARVIDHVSKHAPLIPILESFMLNFHTGRAVGDFLIYSGQILKGAPRMRNKQKGFSLIE